MVVAWEGLPPPREDAEFRPTILEWSSVDAWGSAQWAAAVAASHPHLAAFAIVQRRANQSSNRRSSKCCQAGRQRNGAEMCERSGGTTGPHMGGAVQRGEREQKLKLTPLTHRVTTTLTAMRTHFAITAHAEWVSSHQEPPLKQSSCRLRHSEYGSSSEAEVRLSCL